MAENFEKPPLGEKPEPGPGPEPEPEEEVLGGEPKEGAEKVQIVEKEPETPEEVEAEFHEKVIKLEELMKEIAKAYDKESFDDLEKVAEAMVKPNVPPGVKDPTLIDLVRKVQEKWVQIKGDRRDKLRELAERKREKLGKKLGEI